MKNINREAVFLLVMTLFWTTQTVHGQSFTRVTVNILPKDTVMNGSQIQIDCDYEPTSAIANSVSFTADSNLVYGYIKSPTPLNEAKGIFKDRATLTLPATAGKFRLTVSKVTTKDKLSLSCQVFGINPIQDNKLSVIKQLTVNVGGKPTLTADKTTVAAGTSVTFTCTIKNGGDMTNPISYKFFKATSKRAITSGVTGNYLVITAAGADHNVDYTCKAVDAIGGESQASDAIKLTIQVPRKPSISVDKTTVDNGVSVTFTCNKNTGDLANPTSFKFYKGTSTTPISTGVTGNKLVITATSTDNQLDYTCKAVGVNGDSLASDPVELRVKALLAPTCTLTSNAVTAVPLSSAVFLICVKNVNSQRDPTSYKFFDENGEIRNGVVYNMVPYRNVVDYSVVLC